jgi:anti-repressor protein
MEAIMSLSHGLIPVTLIDGIEMCNARDLYEFLGVNKNFSDWIKYRINQYQFVENVDFVLDHKFVIKAGQRHPTTEYHLTLDMAKELAMVENTDQGRWVRQYFILQGVDIIFEETK